MAVKHSVRRTLATLLVGVVSQRLMQLVTFLCVGRALGAERLGLYAQGLAVAALLSVFAGAGVRNLMARAVAHNPDSAGALVVAAVRARLAIGAVVAAVAIGTAFLLADAPWFWTLCVLQVLPGAFDQKNLLDATGRTRAEVALETATVLLQLLLVLAWLAGGGEDLTSLAAIALASRCVYALLAVPAIARMPRSPMAAAGLRGLRRRAGVALAQSAHEVLTAGDVWFVALAGGDAAAGFYAVASRFAGAALLPSAQLARLLLPHLLHAAAVGDAARTLATASRTTLLVTVPMVAGGAAVAERLCSLPGAQFAAAAPALVLALLGGCLQHCGWQYSHTLLAARQDAAYARGLAAPSLLHALLLLALGLWVGGAGQSLEPAARATIGAGIGLAAQTLYATVGALGVARLRRTHGPQNLARPLLVAAATGIAATLPELWLDGPAVLPMQLCAGGIAFAAGLWLVELRGRLRRLGDGLAQASGFRA